ncbi:MAG: acetyltransferase [Pseudomonadaceae bacterium]|nr:acetyltransferase [Pseudomonadaceae bacterium]
MKSLIVVGEGRALEQACETARESGLDFIKLELPSADRYNFDLSDLFKIYAAADADVFVALDERAVNYPRHKLLAEVRLAGYRLVNIVSPRAIVASDVSLLGNVYIGPGCNLANDCRIGLGSWLGQQVIIEMGANLGACTTLHAGVVLGHSVKIGKGTTLGCGSVVLAGSDIGSRCEWLLGGIVPAQLANSSFYDAQMPAGARILNN